LLFQQIHINNIRKIVILKCGGWWLVPVQWGNCHNFRTAGRPLLQEQLMARLMASCDDYLASPQVGAYSAEYSRNPFSLPSV
jgi:hypothetical protein